MVLLRHAEFELCIFLWKDMRTSGRLVGLRVACCSVSSGYIVKV